MKITNDRSNMFKDKTGLFSIREHVYASNGALVYYEISNSIHADQVSLHRNALFVRLGVHHESQ